LLSLNLGRAGFPDPKFILITRIIIENTSDIHKAVPNAKSIPRTK
jgi:hypothetical protein